MKKSKIVARLIFLLILFSYFISSQNAISSKVSRKSISEMLDLSDLVIMGKVVEINEHALIEENDPLTEVKIEVSESIKGEVEAEILTLTFRGGYLKTGIKRVWSSVPKLLVDDVYILFLKENYYATPLIAAEFSIIRAEEYNGNMYASDSQGNYLQTSNKFGLIKSGKKFEALDERYENRTQKSSAVEFSKHKKREKLQVKPTFNDALEMIKSGQKKKAKNKTKYFSKLRPKKIITSSWRKNKNLSISKNYEDKKYHTDDLSDSKIQSSQNIKDDEYDNND